MSSNDWGVSDETFCGGTPDDEPGKRWWETVSECPECHGTGIVNDGIYGTVEQTCSRCNGTGVENCEFGEGD